MNYETLKITCGALATFGLYSVLYRETKLYRFFEHIFLGLASGWALVAFWTETLKSIWFDKMMGTFADPAGGDLGTPGYFAYVFLPIIGFMAYFVFSKRNAWLAKVPIGIIIGLWSGQQIQVWFTRYGPQIQAAMKPIIPTTFDSLTVPSGVLTPEARALAAQNVYLSQALSNLVFVVTILSVLSYFFYSFDMKGKALGKIPVLGRWLMMVGFGAIFGSTVMTRFTLLIDRMSFLWIEWINAMFRGG